MIYRSEVVKLATLLFNSNIITFVSYVDSRDWKEGYTVDKIVRGVCDNVKSGSIVLFHNAAKNTPKALPIIIEKLIAEGYRLDLISNMIYKENYEIKHDGTQCEIKE